MTRSQLAATAPNRSTAAAASSLAEIPAETDRQDREERHAGEDREAQSVFERWAHQLPMASRDLRSVWCGGARRAHLVGRLRTVLEARRVEWTEAPYRAEQGGGALALHRDHDLDASQIDPFTSPADVRQRSYAVSTCPTCTGESKVACGACSGTLRVVCDGCSGNGKVHGVTSNGHRRMLNCKACRGKASLPCKGCRKGKVSCTRCDATGRVERWLTVERGGRDGKILVKVANPGDVALPWCQLETEYADQELERDAVKLGEVSRDRKVETHELPEELPAAWREAHWKKLQVELAPGERIASQAFALWEVPSLDVMYALRGDQQTVTFEGKRLLPPPSMTDRLFHRRASSLRGWMVALASLPAVVLLAYASRGGYFLNGWTAGVVLSLVACAAVLFGGLWRQSMGRPARRWWLTSTLPALLALGFAWPLEPSLEVARTHLRDGRLAEAEVELGELGEGATGELGVLWGELYARQTMAKASCREAAPLLERAAVRREVWTAARQRADELAVEAATAAAARGELAAVERELECASAEGRGGQAVVLLRKQVALSQAEKCVAEGHWSCARDREDVLRAAGHGDDAGRVRAATDAGLRRVISEETSASRRANTPRLRLDAVSSAVDLWTRFLRKEGETEPSEVTALRAAIAKEEVLVARLDAQVAKQRADEERRRAAVEQRQRIARERAELQVARRVAAEEARAERAEQRRQARYNNSPLLCNDGTLSPTCTCGRASYRGCCSYHGGVDGCSAD